jgi:hypothetical protein
MIMPNLFTLTKNDIFVDILLSNEREKKCIYFYVSFYEAVLNLTLTLTLVMKSENNFGGEKLKRKQFLF